MFITDPDNNQALKVTDLDASILQAKDMIAYGNSLEQSDFHKDRNNYWTHVLAQLQELKTEIE